MKTALIISLILYLFIIFKFILSKQIIQYKSHIKTYFFVILVIWLVINIVLYPQNAVKSALEGLNTWFNIVLPSLLPFFIVSEILIGLGVVNFIGTLLKPIMYPLFRVPGEGAFAFVMSVTSGYPVGAKLVAKLRESNSITRIEAQRLASFCSTSGPLFMIGAVSVGMFKNPLLGPLIAISHYLGALTVGVLFRYYGNKSNNHLPKPSQSSLKEAFASLSNTRQSDGRPIGILLGDAVKDGFNTMLMVGGFIILYSVIIEVLSISHVMDYLTSIINTLSFIKDPVIIKGILSGFIEITIGCNHIAQADYGDFLIKILSVSFLIGWSGLSIHSQVASMLGTTDIRIKLYVMAKLTHGFFSAIYAYFLYHLFFKSSAIMSYTIKTSSIPTPYEPNWIRIFRFSFMIQLAVILLLLFSGILLSLVGKKSKNFFKI